MPLAAAVVGALAVLTPVVLKQSHGREDIDRDLKILAALPEDSSVRELLAEDIDRRLQKSLRPPRVGEDVRLVALGIALVPTGALALKGSMALDGPVSLSLLLAALYAFIGWFAIVLRITIFRRR